MTALMFHLAPSDAWQGSNPASPFVPEAFARDGFIHCTDGVENVVEVGNRYYRDDPRAYVLLVIDTALVTSEVRYEDPGRIYPHIYGPLNREAVVSVVVMPRDADRTFRAPTVTLPAREEASG